MMAKYRPSASQKNVNAATLKWHLKKIWPEIFWLIIYTSYGRLGHFLLQLWLRRDDKYKTRVLNGPINLTARPSYILVRHS